MRLLVSQQSLKLKKLVMAEFRRDLTQVQQELDLLLEQVR
jgi:hypothetical protein